MPLKSGGAIDNEQMRGRANSGLISNKVDPTLVLDLPFSEGIGSIAHDRSLYGNHATIYGANWVDGKVGKGLSFDGIDNYVRAPFPIQLLGNQPHTIELWLKLAADIASYTNILAIGKPEVTKLFRLSFSVPAPYTKKLIGWFYGVSPGGLSGSLNLEQLYHIAEVYEPNTSKFYVDGVHTSTINGLSPDPNLEAGYVDLGLRYLGYANLKGILDEVHVYNRGLIEAEIQLHYSEGK